MKVTETSLLLALSQWLDVETVLLPSSSVGLFSGNSEKEIVKMHFLAVCTVAVTLNLIVSDE